MKSNCVFPLALLFLLLVAIPLFSQEPATRLVTGPIDEAQRVTLPGNVHPLAQARYDRGAVPDSFAAERMLLLLKRPPEREAALQQFLLDAHTKGSPNYHKWITPEEFATRFGPADADIVAVSAWLQSHGFTVARVTKGKTAIEFSGSAGQVRGVFNTEIHIYVVNGVEHHSNNRDPQIPAALAGVVAGTTPMNDFHPKSLLTILGKASYDPSTHKLTPEWTQGPDFLYVAPGDLAVQYDLNPLYSAGTNGNGVTLGIIGESNVDPSVIAEYRSLMSLPAGGSFNVIIDGNDPGETGAEVESLLDVQVSTGVAPNAAINLYTAADTFVQSGLNLAAQRAVDDDQADVLSTSYGTCEQQLGSAGNQFWATLWEQAAAQGQTSFVSAGDGGSAGCDDFDVPYPAQQGLAVNGVASTPWNVSVGGTDFFYSSYNGSITAQTQELGTYWDLTLSTFLPSTSLLKPVPEQPWNRPFGLNLSNGGVYNSGEPSIVAGSGGASSCSSGTGGIPYASCTGGYGKPAWQTGPGVPSDGARDLPDVSLFAGAGDNYSFYTVLAAYVVEQDAALWEFLGVGGTSGSSPAMAGIMALVNQKYGRQGQANFTLYPLAVQHPSVFHDIAIGSNNVPCQQGSPDCTLSTLSDNTNGFYTLGHYYAGPGYDQASGLGSVDASLLVQYWNSLSFAPSNTTLSLSQTSITHGTPINVSIAVTGNGGTPSGDVGLVTTASPTVNTGLGELTLQSGAALGSFNNFPGGQYQVTARYAGDGIFAPSTSASSTLSVAPEASTIAFLGAFTNGGSYPFDQQFPMDAQPIGVNAPHGGTDGIATGTITFTDAASAGSISSGAVNLNSQSVAEWIPATGFAVGTHSVSASYSGDASFNASSSSTPFTFTITKGIPTVLVSASPTSIPFGSTIMLQATVLVSFSAYQSATGTVSFYDGNTLLGTVPLFALLANEGQANLNLTTLPLGANSITATYNGDANFNSASSNPLTVQVGQNSHFSASASPDSITEFQSTTVTATVTAALGLPAPTGVVKFSGSFSVPTACSVALANGTASCVYNGNAFNAGKNFINVSYAGDSNYGSAQVVVGLTVTSVPFAIAATPVTIAAPGAATGNTSTIVISPGGSFSGAVTLSCALTTSPSGATNLPTCTVPSSVAVAGASAVTTTMTISSTASGTSALLAPGRNGVRWLTANAALAIGGVFLLGMPALRGRKRAYLCALFCLTVLGGLAACGGGGHTSGGSGGSGGSGAVTTAGAYTFTVTGTTPNGTTQTYSTSTTVAVTIQ